MRSSISSLVSSEGPGVLRVENLSGPLAAPVIHHVSLAVPSGATHLVIGPIHAGKTMLLRHIVGLEQPLNGRIYLEGARIDDAIDSETQLRRLRARLGVVFEGSALLSRISAIENVELPLLEHSKCSPAEARDTARELLAEVGMADAAGASADDLPRSGGRRIAIARALALRPAVLLLDEPTQGLDAGAAHEIDDLLSELQQRHGFGILIFSHEVRHAFGLATEIYVMADGTIIARGDREELASSENEIVRQLLHRRGTAA
jgi:phospholipid/cholesterol/gamma-HCH transport system ATP-binding protein